MRNNNEYSYSDGFGTGGQGGAPIIAPVFATTPQAPYAAPIAPILGGGYGGGFGEGGLLGTILAASVLGNGFGNRRNDCDNDNAFPAAILGKLGSIEGAVPLAAITTNNAILESTAAVTNQINQVGLAQLNATSGVKDSVQNAATAILLNDNNNAKEILGAICGLSSKIDQNRISELETELSRQRNDSRSRDVEINVTQQVNQQQTQLQLQQQQQGQFNQLFSLFNHLAGDIQAVKQGQVIFNSGTMAASGTQAAANTKVA